MAADGRTTAGTEIVNDRSVKLARLSDGSIVGWSGHAQDAAEAVLELDEAMAEGRKPQPAKGKYTLLRLRPDGTILHYYERLVPVELQAPASIGSGGEYAKGAMLSGLDPKAAVKVAMKTDSASGGKVRTLSL